MPHQGIPTTQYPEREAFSESRVIRQGAAAAGIQGSYVTDTRLGARTHNMGALSDESERQIDPSK